MSKFTSTIQLSALSLSLTASLFLIAPLAHAADCGNDPIFERSMTGAPTIALRVRDIACMEGSKVLTTVSAGTAVSIIGETDGWYKVKVGDVVGWMGSSLMKVTNGSATVADKVVAEPAPAIAVVSADLGKKTMVGILESDYKKIDGGNKTLIKRLKDKVLLRVQKGGETWYVEKDGKLSRVKMYSKNMFKRAVEEKAAPKKESAKEEAVLGAAGTITLTGEALPGGVKITWNITGDGSKGFKFVKSEEINPEYPGDSAEYIDANTRTITRYGLSAKTYHFRVCRYTGNGCDTYSNDLELTIPASTTTETSSKYQLVENEIQVTAKVLPGAVQLNWSKRTSDGFQGYKVVRSLTNADPSYPSDSYLQYITDRETLSFVDGEALQGKTYFYRICSLESNSPVTCGNVVKAAAGYFNWK